MVNAFFGGLAAGAAQGLTDFLNDERKRTSDIVNRAADYQMRTNLSRREQRQKDVEKYKNAFNEMTALTGSELLSAALLKKSNNNMTQARLMAENLNKTARVLGQTPVDYVDLTEDPNITVDIDSIAGSLAEPFKPMNITAEDLAGIPDWQRRSAEKMLGRANKDIIQPEEEQVSFDFDNIPDIDDSFLTFDADSNYLQRARVFTDMANRVKESDPEKANQFMAQAKEALEIAEIGRDVTKTNKYTIPQQNSDRKRFSVSIAQRTGQQDLIVENQFGQTVSQTSKQAALVNAAGSQVTKLTADAISAGMKYEDINVEIEEILATGYMPVLQFTDDGNAIIEQGNSLFKMFGLKDPYSNSNVTGGLTDSAPPSEDPQYEANLIDTYTDDSKSVAQRNAALNALAAFRGQTPEQVKQELGLQ